MWKNNFHVILFNSDYIWTKLYFDKIWILLSVVRNLKPAYTYININIARNFRLLWSLKGGKLSGKWEFRNDLRTAADKYLRANRAFGIAREFVTHAIRNSRILDYSLRNSTKHRRIQRFPCIRNSRLSRGTHPLLAGRILLPATMHQLILPRNFLGTWYHHVLVTANLSNFANYGRLGGHHSTSRGSRDCYYKTPIFNPWLFVSQHSRGYYVQHHKLRKADLHLNLPILQREIYYTFLIALLYNAKLWHGN